VEAPDGEALAQALPGAVAQFDDLQLAEHSGNKKLFRRTPNPAQ
jgi:hypothetical protein